MEVKRSEETTSIGTSRERRTVNLSSMTELNRNIFYCQQRFGIAIEPLHRKTATLETRDMTLRLLVAAMFLVSCASPAASKIERHSEAAQL
jgi:hypothetical protein